MKHLGQLQPNINLTRFQKNEEGQGLAEYSIILMLVAIVAIGATTTLGQSLIDLLEDAVRALGEPIKAGFVVNGAISTSGSSGRAEMSIPVSGSRDKGTVTVVAVKSDGVWQLTTLELVPKQYPDRIDLLAER